MKRLGINDEEFDRLMTLPKRTLRDLETYYPTFKRMHPFF
jgi:hypothetical protein